MRNTFRRTSLIFYLENIMVQSAQRNRTRELDFILGEDIVLSIITPKGRPMKYQTGTKIANGGPSRELILVMTDNASPS
jgi:hypothetical protein